MAFKTVTDLDADTTISIGGFNKKARKENPTEVEGYFLGTKKVANTKTGGDSCLHILQTAKGNVGVWGKTDMDKKMINVPAGEMVKITFTGMQATPKGEMYKFLVQHDPENTIEVLASNTSSYQDTDETIGDQSDAYLPSSFEVENQGQDEELAALEAAAAAKRQAQAAKVQALLSKNKKG